MSKATLEFDLDNPDDVSAYVQVVRARELNIAIWEFDQELRLKIKYPPDDLPESILHTYEEIRELLWEKFEEYKVDIGD
jgi:hypothetical protein